MQNINFTNFCKQWSPQVSILTDIEMFLKYILFAIEDQTMVDDEDDDDVESWNNIEKILTRDKGGSFVWEQKVFVVE